MSFFLIFVTTLILTRLFCILSPRESPTIFGFRTHHYMTGLLLIVVSIFFSSTPLFAVGLALFVDELPLFIFWRKWNWADYLSVWSFLGIVLFSILVFIFQGSIITIIQWFFVKFSHV